MSSHQAQSPRTCDPLRASDRGKADEKRQLAFPTPAFCPEKTNQGRLSQESPPQHPRKQKRSESREPSESRRKKYIFPTFSSTILFG